MKSEEELKKVYENSFPRIKEGWGKLVEARNILGDKDFYFMIFRLQKEINEESSYTLKPNKYKQCLLTFFS